VANSNKDEESGLYIYRQRRQNERVARHGANTSRPCFHVVVASSTKTRQGYNSVDSEGVPLSFRLISRGTDCTPFHRYPGALYLKRVCSSCYTAELTTDDATSVSSTNRPQNAQRANGTAIAPILEYPWNENPLPGEEDDAFPASSAWRLDSMSTTPCVPRLHPPLLIRSFGRRKKEKLRETIEIGAFQPRQHVFIGRTVSGTMSSLQLSRRKASSVLLIGTTRYQWRRTSQTDVVARLRKGASEPVGITTSPTRSRALPQDVERNNSLKFDFSLGAMSIELLIVSHSQQVLLLVWLVEHSTSTIPDVGGSRSFT
jgi:hypothetical protein